MFLKKSYGDLYKYILIFYVCFISELELFVQ